MVEDKWADLMSQLMKIAQDLFQSVENFQKGKLIAEVEAEKNVRIEIARDRDGRINANLSILPSVEEEIKVETESKEETSSSEAREESPTEEEKESLKEEIEVLDLDEEKTDLPSINLEESSY